MASHFSHAHPFIIRNARYTLLFNMVGTTGIPANNGSSSPTYKYALDGSTSLTACAEAPVNDINSSPDFGGYFITLTGAETNGRCLKFQAGSSSTPSSTVAVKLQLRGVIIDLPTLTTGTATAGSSNSITLGSPPAFDLTGCWIRTTGGTGGGGTGGANNQARQITAYNTSTGVATVYPNWETNPANGTTYDILVGPLAVNAPLGRFLRPTTDGYTLDVTATGEAGIDWNNIGNKTATNALTGTTLAPVYFARLAFEQNGGTDKYRVKWFKDGVPQNSGVTSPTIQVVKEDGTDLVASTAMTDAGSNDFKYSEATNVVANGVTVHVKVAATIDGSTRNFSFPLSPET